MDEIQKNLLLQVADLHEVPEGAYNIRSDGESAGRRTTENIDIVTKTDKNGIDIIIKPGTKKESLHIVSSSELLVNVSNSLVCSCDVVC